MLYRVICQISGCSGDIRFWLHFITETAATGGGRRRNGPHPMPQADFASERRLAC